MKMEISYSSTEKRRTVLKLQTSKNSSVGSKSYVIILKKSQRFKKIYYDQKYFKIFLMQLLKLEIS